MQITRIEKANLLAIILTAFVIVTLLAPTPVVAGERVLKIKIRGSVVAGTPSTVTVEELEKLPLTVLSTFDPFGKKQLNFKGVLLEDLATSYGTRNVTKIRLSAIDGYQVVFSPEEWQTKKLLLATRIEDKKIDRRQSGPARVVLPFDEGNASEAERLYTTKWIWMVNKIEFLEK